MNDALFVPVFVMFDTSGRVKVDVTAPIVAQAGSKEDQIVELTRKYGEMFAARWPSIYASMGWSHLKNNYDLPVI
jgi:hypothetical protein